MEGPMDRPSKRSPRQRRGQSRTGPVPLASSRGGNRPERRKNPLAFLSILGFGKSDRRSRSDRPAQKPPMAQVVPMRPNQSRSNPVVPIRPNQSIPRGETRRDRRLSLRQERSQLPQINLPSPRTRSGRGVLYGLRLLIFGVGIAVLAGTLLSMFDPASRMTPGSATADKTPAEAQVAADGLGLTQEIPQLKSQIQTLFSAQKQLAPGVLLVDLDSRAYVDLNASQAFPSASTIKFPILVAFFQDVDAGKIQLDEPLVMRKELVATESGDMQESPAGTKFSALETATKMIVISDNTATNMMIDRLGGMPALSQRFQSWGMASTQLRTALPDVQGTNTTSAKDLASLFGQVQSGKLISIRSRDRLLEIMRRTENDTMLVKGLGQGASIAHKTGSIGTLVGDVGLIDTPTGKRYLAAVLVQRPRDDDRAIESIRQVSRLAYQTFGQAPTAAQPAAKPADGLGRSRIAQP
jgi:beta-lactamase class A